MSTEDSKPMFGCYRNPLSVWFSASRWRKASKCELYVNDLICSIKIHRRRRMAMLRQCKSDIALHFSDGCLSQAFSNAQQSFEDERRLLAYDRVEYLCVLLLENLKHLKHQSDVLSLPEETQTTMAGLIFAASRMGEFKELQYIRSLFAERFGLVFDKECVDLRPGHLVSQKIIETM
ncbi:unnamed protein product [Cochlearia groenlandica]